MINRFWRIGAFLASTAVAAGAFGAHALAERIDVAALATFETAARYQMFHALGLIAVALRGWHSGAIDPWLARAGWCFTLGVVLFCGALYILALGGPRWFGAVAPAGGALFIAGWLCLAATTGKPGR